ncbi:hypothetical protein [Phytoactinopolyspora endophytica]|uniref:hypothetical protein n=1 Tax=Phytoactinopolyspora endophytica TaxID=1642495 RepID=UPI0013ECA977|nr:hypothetical protein [Phytoactinopolyspora endophytica]
METIEDSADEQAIGSLVNAALNASEQDVPLPPRRGMPPEWQKLLEMAGVRSQREFADGLKGVSIRQMEPDGEMKVTPQKNRGPKEGLGSLGDKAVVVSDVDYEAVGRAVKEALKRAI